MGKVGCAVANIFQSIGEAPSAIGPITSISLTQDDALVSFTVVQRDIRLVSMICLRCRFVDLYGTTALSTSNM